MLGRKTKEDRPTSRAGHGTPPTGVDSVISKEMTIEGSCRVEGRIRIEGRIRGSVEAADLELAESGAVEGDVTCTTDESGGPFVIAGRVAGAVRAPRVEVAPSGTVLQGVEGDEVEVRGRVQGGVVARERLALKETAVVEGDVRARVLGLEEGGQVNGAILMGERAAESPPEEPASHGAGEAHAGKEKPGKGSPAAASASEEASRDGAPGTEGDGTPAAADEAMEEEPAA